MNIKKKGTEKMSENELGNVPKHVLEHEIVKTINALKLIADGCQYYAETVDGVEAQEAFLAINILLNDRCDALDKVAERF